jgi:hypothetical protein
MKVATLLAFAGIGQLADAYLCKRGLNYCGNTLISIGMWQVHYTTRFPAPIHNARWLRSLLA